MANAGMIHKGAKAFNRQAPDMVAYDGFVNQFHDWIHSSRQPVRGLPGERYIVSGITEAFNQTYGLYGKIGVFDGEYGYHSMVLGDRVTTDLSEADAIIISHPFSADGNCSHHRIAEADALGKPIFIDCAFFGICSGVSFDFTGYRNIHSVCFSLSKIFGLGFWRVGMLYTVDAYPVRVYSGWNYEFVAGAERHYGLLSTQGPDHAFDAHRDRQLAVCERLGVMPSSTVIFGIDHTDRYREFKRGGVNRLCITDLLYEEGS